MALVELGKQLAQQALTDAITGKEKETAPTSAAPPLPGMVILNQIHAMQKALKEDEELAVYFQSGAERIRVMEIFLPSPTVAVLTGPDANRNLTRAIVSVDTLQLLCKTVKVPAGAKPASVSLVTPKKGSSA